MDALAEKNLLIHRDGRYMMLETVRELALDRLEESGMAGHTRQRMPLGSSAWRRSSIGSIPTPGVACRTSGGRGQRGRIEKLDNLRAAHKYLIDCSEREQALRFACLLERLWEHSSQLASEGIRWLRAALEAVGEADGAIVARATYLLRACEEGTGRYDDALMHEALRLVRAHGDREAEFSILTIMAACWRTGGELDKARQLIEEAAGLRWDDPMVCVLCSHRAGMDRTCRR